MCMCVADGWVYNNAAVHERAIIDYQVIIVMQQANNGALKKSGQRGNNNKRLARDNDTNINPTKNGKKEKRK